MCKSIDLALVARSKERETNSRKIFRDYDFLRGHYLDNDTGEILNHKGMVVRQMAILPLRF